MCRTIALFTATIGLAKAAATAVPATAQPVRHPAGKRAMPRQAYVTAGVLVRSRPTTHSRIAGHLRRGDFVTVGACRGIGCKADAYDGNGWVQARFIGRGATPYHVLAAVPAGTPQR